MNCPARAGLLALLMTSLLVSVQAVSQQSPPGRPTVAVIVEIVRYQPISDSLEALGTLRASESVRITASVSDTISQINFADGQSVAAGDLLVALTDTEESALLREAESLAEEAQRQYERIQRLVKLGNAAESLLDERHQQTRTAQARLEAVRSRLKDRLIIAPFAGRVGLRMVSPGALVSPGDVITTLVDDSSMKLDFTIPAIYLSTIQPGTLIEAYTPAYPERIFSGEVSSIDSTIDPVTRSIIVRALIPNADHALIPGMLMTLNLQRNAREAIVISEEAIIPQADKTFVMVVDTTTQPNTVEQRLVTLGTRMPGQVEVIENLAPGETIVSHGTLKVRSGSTVRIKAVYDGTQPLVDLIKPDNERNPG